MVSREARLEKEGEGEAVGELDLARLFDTFKAMGLAPQNFRPDLPDVDELRAMLQNFEARRGEPFRILGAQEVHPEAQAEDQNEAA